MGLIYDKDENKRLIDFLTEQEDILKKEEKKDTTKDVIRYAFIGLGAVLVIVIVSILNKRK